MGQSAILRALSANQKLIEAQAKELGKQREVITRQGKAITVIAKLAGIESHVAKAVTADSANPAQPVPSPGSEGPAETTEQARGDKSNSAPGGGGNQEELSSPGAVPGKDEGVKADATDTVENVGTSLDTPPYQENQDVTKPVSGADTPRPLSETKTEIQPVAPPAPYPGNAFPPQGEFANEPKTTGSARMMASLRLAKLQCAAGITDGDELVVAQSIHDSDTPDTMIARDIATLDEARAAALRQTADRPPKALVPQAAGKTGARTAPSLRSEAVVTVPVPEVAAGVTDEESLFE